MICPCKTGEIAAYDTWALQLLSKVPAEYYAYTGEERVLLALYDAIKNYYTLLRDGTIRLFDWGKARWFETCIAIRLLYEKFPEPWLPELVRLLKAQGTDYSQHASAWQRPLNRWTFETHVVNLSMMLKSEAVSCDLLGEDYTEFPMAARNCASQNCQSCRKIQKYHRIVPNQQINDRVHFERQIAYKRKKPPLDHSFGGKLYLCGFEKSLCINGFRAKKKNAYSIKTGVQLWQTTHILIQCTSSA